MPCSLLCIWAFFANLRVVAIGRPGQFLQGPTGKTQEKVSKMLIEGQCSIPAYPGVFGVLLELQARVVYEHIHNPFSVSVVEVV